mmetsp:Transcript_10427/g.29684  ORF Transcript_10427/g.29684 Transcript_10427/m.29684 type:complete len:331 (-) Transcript_10427:384-1376(-)|eukprot:CAMPEP_0117678188 /NCGR_PEP_ID=MMETSP0804-20121206/17158_1 /TAXON_ID=1074897 /ORGANISM="Tetraselmis astigmatica, Strain CCMP880" /LENGTH=330 /DNA_ID=CAMNT_0005487547 /DNA_START=191 /DNA_END=1183 /DNA_ORIENTATION=-
MLTSDVPASFRTKKGKVPAYLRGAKFYPRADPEPLPELDADTSPKTTFTKAARKSHGPLDVFGNNFPVAPHSVATVVDGKPGFKLGAKGPQGAITSEIVGDINEIRGRLRTESEWEGVDPWNLKDHEFERAMELGFLPLEVVVDYVADMFTLAKLGKLGRPMPIWAVKLVEASNLVQRRWRAKSKLFKGHENLVETLFADQDKWKKAAELLNKEIKKRAPMDLARDKEKERFWKAYLEHVSRADVGRVKKESKENTTGWASLPNDSDGESGMPSASREYVKQKTMVVMERAAELHRIKSKAKENHKQLPAIGGQNMGLSVSDSVGRTVWK